MSSGPFLISRRVPGPKSLASVIKSKHIDEVRLAAGSRPSPLVTQSLKKIRSDSMDLLGFNSAKRPRTPIWDGRG
jgi:hypothetical protein